jgi:hypothetical protein
MYRNTRLIPKLLVVFVVVATVKSIGVEGVAID